MRYIDEYRDERIATALVGEIASRVTRPWAIMEICGGQTHTLMRYGIDRLLPAKIELLHGPGCPVCVTPVETLDQAIQVASLPNAILASYGDMLRVPGSQTDLLHVKANGGDVRVVYSPMDALKMARANPQRKVVFLAIGFETTAPANGMAVWQARKEGLKNFSLLVSQVLVPPAIRMILSSPGHRVQGFIAPGHVCTVTGYQEYEVLCKEFRVPFVVGGFEPLDLLEAISMLVNLLETKKARVENQYLRSVSREGNSHALELMEKVYEVCDRKWRGLGVIPRSGLRLREEFAEFDAEKIFHLEARAVAEPKACIGTQVLLGLKKPNQCHAFGKACKPESPIGALMVSPEGACAAYYQYRRQRETPQEGAK